MKSSTILIVVAILFITGCYDSPLTKKHNIPIDSRLLGLWGEGEVKSLLVLKYSNTEYIFHILAGNDDVYFRGYLVEIGNIPCIQLQAIGTDDGALHPEEKTPFYVVSYLLINDELELKIINTDLVSTKLQGTEALKRAFLKHKYNKDLFIEPKTLRRFKD